MPRATLEEIAQVAGVSTATVNRVLKHATNVSDRTRQKVIKAADSLGRLYTLPIVGIVSPRTDNAFFAELTLEVQKYLATKYLPLLLNTDSDRSQNYDISGPRVFTAIEAVGVVHLHADHRDPTIISSIARTGIPMVVLGHTDTAGNADFVTVDSRTAMKDMVAHLADLGHRRFAFVNGLAGAFSAIERLGSFRQAAERVFGRTGEPYSITEFAGNYRFDDALEIGRTVALSGPDDPTAVVCANDEMAAAVLRGVRERGFDVPGDVSIVGYDNSRLCELTYPTLASMGPSMPLLAQRAGRLLDTRIKATNVADRDWPAAKTEAEPARYVPSDDNSVGPALAA